MTAGLAGREPVFPERGSFPTAVPYNIRHRRRPWVTPGRRSSSSFSHPQRPSSQPLYSPCPIFTFQPDEMKTSVVLADRIPGPRPLHWLQLLPVAVVLLLSFLQHLRISNLELRLAVLESQVTSCLTCPHLPKPPGVVCSSRRSSRPFSAPSGSTIESQLIRDV